MTFFVLLVAVLLVGFAVAAVSGRLGPALDDPTSSQASFGLPEAPTGELSAQAVEQVRLDQALRGYRMDQVDAVLDRLAGELRSRDAELAQLRGQPPRDSLDSIDSAREPLAELDPRARS